MRYTLAILALLAVPAGASAACFDVEKGQPATLTGELRSVLFEGPPDPSHPDKGNTSEPGFVLKLAAPICITDSEELADPTDMFDEVQLVPQEQTFDAMAASAGKTVTVTLSNHVPAHTRYHRRPLVGWVDAIRAD